MSMGTIVHSKHLCVLEGRGGMRHKGHRTAAGAEQSSVEGDKNT